MSFPKGRGGSGKADKQLGENLGAGLASIGQSIHPFLRMLRGMKDGINVNGFSLNAVEDHVRELLDDRSRASFAMS